MLVEGDRDICCPHALRPRPLMSWRNVIDALLFVGCYAVGGAVLLVFALLFGGCAYESQVRRADTLTDVDAVTDEAGADGWRLVAITPQRDAFVLVFERRVRP